MRQTTIFTKDELIWMLNGGISVSDVAGAKHEYMSEETYERKYLQLQEKEICKEIREKNND